MLVEVRVSCPDEATAAAIGAAAVEGRLAACAHVVPLRSIYRWQGEVHRETEYAVALRTRETLVERLAGLIAAMHPYELPAIMSYPCRADAATTRWVETETS